MMLMKFVFVRQRNKLLGFQIEQRQSMLFFFAQASSAQAYLTLRLFWHEWTNNPKWLFTALSVFFWIECKEIAVRFEGFCCCSTPTDRHTASNRQAGPRRNSQFQQALDVHKVRAPNRYSRAQHHKFFLRHFFCFSSKFGCSAMSADSGNKNWNRTSWAPVILFLHNYWAYRRMPLHACHTALGGRTRTKAKRPVSRVGLAVVDADAVHWTLFAYISKKPCKQPLRTGTIMTLAEFYARWSLVSVNNRRVFIPCLIVWTPQNQNPTIMRFLPSIPTVYISEPFDASKALGTSKTLQLSKNPAIYFFGLTIYFFRIIIAKPTIIWTLRYSAFVA